MIAADGRPGSERRIVSGGLQPTWISGGAPCRLRGSVRVTVRGHDLAVRACAPSSGRLTVTLTRRGHRVARRTVVAVSGRDPHPPFRHSAGDRRSPRDSRLSRSLSSHPGTRGFRDLLRGAEPIDIEGGELHVASVLDLLRIADASDRRRARLEALAYQAVLDLQDARSKEPTVDGRTATERIEAWLKPQTPATT